MKIGPKYKICRRVGDRVFGKCQTTKFTISGPDKKRRTGKRPKGAPSEYSLQLLEKQKARFTYGVTERQFAKYVAGIKKHEGSNRAISMFKTLETRLDNVIFRLGLAPSRALARQLVSHGHILVNNRRTRVPSTQVRVGDKISIRPQSKNNGVFQNLTEKTKDYTIPEWLSLDLEKGEGVVKGEPIAGKAETTINFELILEFYSR
ncbi:MAG TPA: 30S ribosomal protein S4 [Candidatus Paceibacterota bacterium]|jgi:small subunit ribosomal protein S4|nr:30S ribosomal protein S4 [Candidatus Paceibacterota bacterium]HOH11349.1 30S ribosomal protein S4 [Candidatus Paceibacterota bacterium]HOY10923.1 30S ribosomal protein S4 [Candidatus Paceibacterota bacterium]HPI24635.1 30S ribosomal protein S4 [Candidatus Paceibacterota bacterium]HPN89300.1 30S ribosomal protein S4 [Candidatus Paceibacterota bacterium]